MQITDSPAPGGTTAKVASLAAFRQARLAPPVSRRDQDYEAWVDNLCLDRAGDTIIASMDNTEEALTYAELTELAWDLKEKARIALEENETMRVFVHSFNEIAAETREQLQRLLANPAAGEQSAAS